MYRILVFDTFLGVGLQKVYRPRTDAELPGLEKLENLTCGKAA